MLEILQRISEGKGREGDIEKLIELGEDIMDTALCGLGQTAPNPRLIPSGISGRSMKSIHHKYCRASVCASLFDAPCQNACPAGVDVPQYIEYIQRGMYMEAVNSIREMNPFPSVCGRVCTHPCEARCRRAQLDEPLAIRSLKGLQQIMSLSTLMHFILIWKEGKTKKGKKVAVIGEGLPGLLLPIIWQYGDMTSLYLKLPKDWGDVELCHSSLSSAQ